MTSRTTTTTSTKVSESPQVIYEATRESQHSTLLITFLLNLNRYLGCLKAQPRQPQQPQTQGKSHDSEGY